MNMNSISENVASRPTGERTNERRLWVSIKSGRVDSEVTSRFPIRIGAGLGDIALGVCMRIYLSVLLLIHLVAGFAGGRMRAGPEWKEIAARVRDDPLALSCTAFPDADEETVLQAGLVLYSR